MNTSRPILVTEDNAQSFLPVGQTPLAPAGGDPRDPGMEARVAKVESDIGHIQRDVGEIKTDIRDMRKSIEIDFRLLFGALIVVVIGLAAIMAKGFHWI